MIKLVFALLIIWGICIIFPGASFFFALMVIGLALAVGGTLLAAFVFNCMRGL